MYSAALHPDKSLPPLRSLNIPYRENTDDPLSFEQPERNSLPRASQDWFRQSSPAQPQYSPMPSYPRSDYHLPQHSSSNNVRAYTYPQPSPPAGYATHSVDHGPYAMQHQPASQLNYRYPNPGRPPPSPQPDHDHRKKDRSMFMSEAGSSRDPLILQTTIEDHGYSHGETYNDTRNSGVVSPHSAPPASYPRFDYPPQPPTPAPPPTRRPTAQDRPPGIAPSQHSPVASSSSPQEPWSAPYPPYPPHHHPQPQQQHTRTVPSPARQSSLSPFAPSPTSLQEHEDSSHSYSPQRMINLNRDHPPTTPTTTTTSTPIQPQQLLSQAYSRMAIPNNASSPQYQPSTVHPHQLQNSRPHPPPAPPPAPQVIHRVGVETSPTATRVVGGPYDRRASGSSSSSQALPPQALSSRAAGASGYVSPQDGMMMSYPPPLPDTEREQTLNKIINHCTLLNDFALRYGRLRNELPTVSPSTVEMGQMTSMAQDVLLMLDTIKRTDLTVEEGNRLDMEMKETESSSSYPMAGTSSSSTGGGGGDAAASPVDAYVVDSPIEMTTTTSTATNTTPSPEDDMVIIRQKRMSSTAPVPTPPLAQLKGKYRKRGRSTPPGKCHSCNSRETPEWRRGPDGARTLCNACGLHYAKLTRKRDKSGGEMPPINIEMLRASARAQDPTISPTPTTPTSFHHHIDKPQRRTSSGTGHNRRSGGTMDMSMAIEEEGQGGERLAGSGPVRGFHIITFDPSPKAKQQQGGGGEGGDDGDGEEMRQTPVQWERHQFAESNARGYS